MKNEMIQVNSVELINKIKEGELVVLDKLAYEEFQLKSSKMEEDNKKDYNGLKMLSVGCLGSFLTGAIIVTLNYFDISLNFLGL